MAWSIFTQGGGDQMAVGWAQQLLKMISAPVTPRNTQFVYDWEKSEGGGGKFNPLNQGPVPGQPQLTTTGQQYGGGAADFASWQAGLTGAAAYLNMPNYAKVRDALRADDPVAARAALIASPWAASHYGGGSGFSNAPVPGGAPLMPPLGTSATLTATSATLTSVQQGPTCLYQFPGMRTPLGTYGSFCVLSKTEGRAVAGYVMIVNGAVVLVVGLAFLAAFGLTRTRAGKAAMGTAGSVRRVTRKLG